MLTWSYVDYLIDTLNLPVTPEQRMACWWLELRGEKFCVDFGYENAIALMEEMSETTLCQLTLAGIH